MMQPPKKVRVRHNYIDKEQFHSEMTKYRLSVIEAEKNGTEKPRVNNYIGNCFYMLCERMSYRPNFMNYSFREELVGDAIENCLAAVDNFNPADEKKNPFGYFSLIAWRAMLRRIEKEKKQNYIKHKSFHNSGLYDQLAYGDDAGVVGINQMNNDVSNRIIEQFETKMNEKKAPKETKGGVEKFLDDE